MGAPGRSGFSEKAFYLDEFRGRTLAFAVPPEAEASAPLRALIEELAENGTRVLVLAPAPVTGLGIASSLDGGAETIAGDVWRALRGGRVVGIALGAESFASACRELVVALGVTKLVWLDRDGGLARPDAGRHSFVDRAGLDTHLADGEHPRAALLAEIAALLDAGVASVNLCAPDGVADELFTYAGSGTLFTRERYLEVRRLGVDDYDAAHDLFQRGVEEGYLAPRSPRDVERILAGGIGAFVEGRHLAGIGALLVYPEEEVGEVASLYTLTRFLGEGVGAYVVAFAAARARALGLRRLFGCTTAERVGAFFERQGFTPVPADALPEARWKGYDPERRARVRCYELRL